MNQQEQLQIKKTLLALSAYYSKQLPDEALNWYVQDLVKEGFTFNEASVAIDTYRRTDKFGRMPTVAQLIEVARPTANAKDLARVTALRIREAVTKFGWPNPTEAHLFIGNAGWRVVERFGGWRYICENLGLDLQETTFLAQARDVLESDINLGRAGFSEDRPAIEQAKERGQLTSAADVLKSLNLNVKQIGEKK